jgi:hypothetical protein
MRELGNGMTLRQSAAKRSAPPPSRLLPRPFQPRSETCLPQPSKLLPSPFRPPSKTCSLSPLIPPGPGSLEASGPPPHRENLEQLPPTFAPVRCTGASGNRSNAWHDPFTK